jgi:predicted kinase
MPKIIFERGLPASGKSTCSRDRTTKNGNTVRVNRDDIRAMGFGMHRWTRHREDWVVASERAMVTSAIKQGFSAVVDSTNMTQGRLDSYKNLAKELGVQFEVCDHTNVPIRELIYRDNWRQGSARVGRVVIERMAAMAGMLKTDKPVVICDVDGTVANLEHRQHYVTQSPKNWVSFFEEVSLDKPIPEVIEFVNQLADTHSIWVVSGRPDFFVKDDRVIRVAQETENWLQLNGLKFDHLFMREAKDKRDDDLVKKDIFEKQILNNISKEQIKLVVDDRPRVIRMWREHGLEVKDVGPGVEF